MAQENSGKLVSKRRNSGKELVELLGVDYVNRWQKKDGANTLNYNNSINLNNLMLDVSGFSYIGRGNFHTSGNAPRKQTLQVVNKNQLQKIAIDYEGDIFKVKIESGESVEFDLVEFILSLKNKQSAAARPNGKTKFVLTQASGNGRLKIRLIVEQMRGETSENNETNITNLRYILLLGLSDPDKDN